MKPCKMAESPEPMPNPAAVIASRWMRSVVVESSTVMTSTSVEAVVSSGRANAKHATKNQ